MSTETREKIVAAAADLVREGGAVMSVRAVAARAGVGASTLRYYFPTQKALFETVLTAVYDEALPDERMRDAAISPRDRLIESLWQLLEPVGVPSVAREVWDTIYLTFIGPEATDNARKGYRVLVGQAEQRVVAWLVILEAEGALAPGDNLQRTRFLLTVLDGLSIERALPMDETQLVAERATLGMAVDAIFRAP